MERPEPKFVPGEMAEVVRVKHLKHLLGRRVRLLSVKWVDEWKDGTRGGWAYKSQENYEAHHSWHESQLRHPPKDEPTTFDASIWQPKEITA